MSEANKNTSEKPTFSKKVSLYTVGNFTVSAYTMDVPAQTRKDGTVVPEKQVELVQLEVVKEKWSDEIKSMYLQKSYITVNSESFEKMIEYFHKSLEK